MLPSKPFQINYEDYSFLVNKDLEKLKEWQTNNQKFDFVLAKLRNGTFSGSIIANELQIPMGVIEAPRNKDISEFKSLIPQEFNDLKNYTILIVDGLSGTGEVLNNLKIYINNNYKNFKAYTYCPIIDKNAKHKPDFNYLEINEFIQPPWENKSFTPQAHLDRLENYNIKGSEEKENCVGFSSINIQKEVENYMGYNFMWTFNFEKEYFKIQSKSVISTLEIKEINNLSELLKSKYSTIIQTKSTYIKDNGMTHFFEENLKEALILSELCPVTKIMYFENGILYTIKGYQGKIE